MRQSLKDTLHRRGPLAESTGRDLFPPPVGLNRDDNKSTPSLSAK